MDLIDPRDRSSLAAANDYGDGRSEDGRDVDAPWRIRGAADWVAIRFGHTPSGDARVGEVLDFNPSFDTPGENQLPKTRIPAHGGFQT